MAYLFAYSLREKTHAHRRMNDDVPEDVKQERLRAMIEVFKKNQLFKQNEDIGKHHLMLIDGTSKKHSTQFTGLTDTNKRVVFEKSCLIHPSNSNSIPEPTYSPQIGDLVEVKITSATQNTLFCTPIRLSSITDFHKSLKEFQ
jgi:tRNA A37 methylthiotransferase MiaB